MSWPVDASKDRLIAFDNEDGVKSDPFIKKRRIYRLGDIAVPALVVEMPTHKEGMIDALSLAGGGAGYQVGDELDIRRFDNEQDSAIVKLTSVDTSGKATTVVLQKPGENYEAEDELSVGGGSGTGCILRIDTTKRVLIDPATEFVDILPTEALGEAPGSEYDDEKGRHIVFEMPLENLKCLTTYCGRLFAIQNCTLRATPVTVRTPGPQIMLGRCPIRRLPWPALAAP